MRSGSRDDGFTLLEVVVVMALAGIVMSIATFGFTNWRNVAQQQGTADELVSVLRNASTQAISEGRTYCLSIAADGRSYTRWRFACDGATGTQVGAPMEVQGNHVVLDATVPYPSSAPMPSPTPACPAGNRCLYFYPRGTAIPAQVVVHSSARSKTYTVRVEGLTARVYQ
jgi:type II secretion system protein H